MTNDTDNRPPENRHQILFVKFASLFLVALLGLLSLPEIFNGDQALFAVYAEEISKGALLYRDVWDVKQPGIFVFYLAGGKLFGFTETGIHLFELIYWLAFSVVLQSTAKNYFRNPLFAQITPLLTVGVYYAVCRDWHLTQVEGLVGFPMYLTLWTAIEISRAGSRQKRIGLAFLSGLAGGAVLIFKLVFLPLPVLFWLLTFLNIFRKKGKSFREIFSSAAVPVFLGASVFPAAVFIYFAWHNALPVVSYTFFQYPSEALIGLTTEDRMEVLKRGILWFVLNFKSLILILTVGVSLKLIARKRNIHPANGDVNLMNPGLMAWLVAGFGIILFQRLSWWEYHYLLLFAPLGILTAKSLEIIWEQAANFSGFFRKPYRKILFAVLIMFLFFPHAKQVVLKARGAFEDRANVQAGHAPIPRNDFALKYYAIRDEVAFLAAEEEAKDAREKIFVLGQPLYYYHSKRGPAISSNGWMPEFFLAEQWRGLVAELRTARPKYIFIEVNLYEQLSANSPETVQFLKNHYRLRNQNRFAYCYELYRPPPPA